MANRFEKKDDVIGKATKYLTERGYEVRRHIHTTIVKLKDGYEMETPVDNPPYDLIITKDDKEFTVSVKTAIRGSGGYKKPDNWRVSYYGVGHPTVFLVWMPHQERFIELSGSFFVGSRGIKAVPIDKVKAWVRP